MFLRSTLLLSIVFIFGCSSSTPDPLPVGTKAPLARLTYLDGAYDSLASFQGQRVAILFWAKWCSKSKSALQEFNQTAAGLNTFRGSSAVFLAIGLDDPKYESEMREYLKTLGIADVRHVYSGNGPDDEAAHLFQVYEIPTAVVIGRNGLIELVTEDMDELDSFLAGS